MGCRYHEFTRQEVFQCLHRKSDNAAIVMVLRSPQAPGTPRQEVMSAAACICAEHHASWRMRYVLPAQCFDTGLRGQ